MTHASQPDAASATGFVAGKEGKRSVFGLITTLLFLCLSLFLAGVANATEAPSGIALLQQVQNAARTLDFSGVYTYQQGATMQSSRITHLVDGTGERERIEVLDGTPREFLRQNDRIQCLIPEQKVVILERRRGDRFPALLLTDDHAIEQHYQISSIESGGRIAGRECSLIQIIPNDDRRYGYRLCVDSKSHLLLKAQTLTPNAQVVDQVVFNTLVLGDQVAAADLDSSWSTRDWKVLTTTMADVDLAQEGWRIPYPAGFSVISQVSRPLRPDHHVKQLVLSDGLAAISIFIELIDPSTELSVTQGKMRNGAMNVFRTRIGDYWLTALGEVPESTLHDMVQRIEYVPLAVQNSR